MKAAVRAVVAASGVCEQVRRTLADADAVIKGDKSPVTVADFASQAVVAAALAETGLPMVAEEDAAELRVANAVVKTRVLEAVRDVHDQAGEDQVFTWIDAGAADPFEYDRYWVLDPIDGTKGFLRGGQYAVALALVVRGQVTLGVLGCPQWQNGKIFAAARNGDPWTAAMDSADKRTPLAVTDGDSLRIVESVESGHSDHDASSIVAKSLGITAEPARMDSQAKYAAVACGDADIYLRLPTRPGYQEKVWDHAAGLVIIEEAGGRVTDVDGRRLDFSLGRTLAGNRGVIATSDAPGLHDRVIKAVAEALRA